MAQVSYPGVYVEELTGSVRTITAVTTSVTAFVGRTSRGPVNRAVTITSFGDFERRFGGLHTDSLLSYGVQQFFLAGGSVAVIVRVAKDANPARTTIPSGSTEGDTAFRVSSQEAGAWAKGLRVAVDPGGTDRFDLRVLNAENTELERFRELSMKENDPRFVGNVIESLSGVVTVDEVHEEKPPNPSGTVSKVLDPLPDLAGKTITARVDGVDGAEFVVYKPAEEGKDDPEKPGSVLKLALLLERKIRESGTGRGFTAARVVVAGNRLQVLAGEPTAKMGLTGTATAADFLGFSQPQPPSYPFETGGEDGTAPGAAEIRGSRAGKSGLYALVDVRDVNLLCLPDISRDGFEGDRISVIAAADELCQEKRMFLILDSPEEWNSLDDARANLSTFDSVRSNYAALYFPHIRMTDPLSGQMRSFPPSGAIAGIIATIDGTRGVWKAPAGTEARLSGVRALTVELTDQENGLLNPLGLNCLRTRPILGPLIWGTRTLEGADELTSEWKYIPVRRLALMIEESLYRGLQWTVFEPNDDRLWGQIRLNVGAFMRTLFRQGAFQGTAAREAYFVKCDSETTTQDDINRGIVNIAVGFAPLKPAEFVVVQIQQMAGRIEV